MTDNKWFKPKRHSGWRKRDSAVNRRKKVLEYTDKRRNIHDRLVQAGRKLLALTNVTIDNETKIKAKEDSNYFFKLAKIIRRGK